MAVFLSGFTDRSDERRFGFARGPLPTGVKVFLILGAMLLPLSLISILASAATGRTATADRIGRLEVELDSIAGRLRRDLVEDQVLVAASASAQSAAGPERGDVLCRQIVERVRTLHSGRVKFVIADDAGRPVCAFAWPAAPPRRPDNTLTASITAETLLIARKAENGWTSALLYSRAELLTMAGQIDLDRRHLLSLESNDGALVLEAALGPGDRLFGTTSLSSGLTGVGLSLNVTVPDLPPTAAQWIAIGLPILMTIGSAMIGWLLVNRLFVRKLTQLTRQVERYTPGAIIDPDQGGEGGSREVNALGTGLRDLSTLVARSIGDVERGLERQTALTREVHHRVKNNLQVIASLISLHSRAADAGIARDAYRTIQRRVDALSVVHRNHFAGTEVTSGVGLTSLLSELTTALQASSEDEASGVSIRLAVVPALVNQDVATSIAFIVTELSELAMRAGHRPQTLAITAEEGEPDHVRLTLQAAAFVASDNLRAELNKRYGRVLTGLSRQLRSPLHHDEEAGTFSIVIPVLTAELGIPPVN